jgi:hypothetical protein
MAFPVGRIGEARLDRFVGKLREVSHDCLR